MSAQEKAVGVLDTPATASQTHHTAILGTQVANRKEYSTLQAALSNEAGIFQIMAGMHNGGAASNDVFLQGHAGSAMRVDRAGRSKGLLARSLFAMPSSTIGQRDLRKHSPDPANTEDADDEYLD